MNTLPNEIIKYVYTYLPTIDLVILMYVNKLLYNHAIDVSYTRRSLQYIKLSHAAASEGYLNILNWLHERGNIIDNYAIINAMKNDNIEVIDWLYSHGYHKLNTHTYLRTVYINGSFKTLQWLEKKKEIILTDFLSYIYMFKETIKKYDVDTMNLLYDKCNKIFRSIEETNTIYNDIKSIVMSFIDNAIKHNNISIINISASHDSYGSDEHLINHYKYILPAVRNNSIDDLKLCLNDHKYSYRIITALNNDNLRCLELLLQNGYIIKLNKMHTMDLIQRNCTKVLEYFKVSKNDINERMLFAAIDNKHIDVWLLFDRLEIEISINVMKHIITTGFFDALKIYKDRWSEFESLEISYETAYEITNWIKLNKPHKMECDVFFKDYIETMLDDIQQHKINFSLYTKY
jgi:hypothetical protein